MVNRSHIDKICPLVETFTGNHLKFARADGNEPFDNIVRLPETPWRKTPQERESSEGRHRWSTQDRPLRKRHVGAAVLQEQNALLQR